MSPPSIPAPDDQDKPFVLIDANIDDNALNTDPLRRLHGRYRLLRLVPVPAAPPSPRRQKPAVDPSTSSPIEHILHSVQTFGFTHPSTGRHFLMVPKEFGAILLLETKAVTVVVWEIMQQTIGWEGDGPGHRREWVHLTKRHFVRASILSRAQVERGMKRALAMGYITRR